jgi:hypothetical protein
MGVGCDCGVIGLVSGTDGCVTADVSWTLSSGASTVVVSMGSTFCGVRINGWPCSMVSTMYSSKPES